MVSIFEFIIPMPAYINFYFQEDQQSHLKWIVFHCISFKKCFTPKVDLSWALKLYLTIMLKMFVRDATTDVGSLPRYRGPGRDVYLDSHVAGLLGPSASTPRNNKLTLLTLYATQPNFCALCSFIWSVRFLYSFSNCVFGNP